MNQKSAAFCIVLATTAAALQDQVSMATEATGDWQLFIDDYWIEESSGITAELHQPTKHADNPLIVGDAEWAINPYGFGTVLFDEEDAVFKLWYMSYNYGFPVADRTPVLYATSVDGVSWNRPALGIHEFGGSKENNILLTNYGHHDLYSPSVIVDPRDPDRERRYKMIWWDFPLGPEPYRDDGMCVAFSPDGIRWTRHPGNPVLSAKKQENSISDVMSVMFDRRSGKYVAYTKGWADPWPDHRQIVRTESTDFVNWTEPQVVLRHDQNLQDPQSYGMSVTQYESVYLGLLASYKKPGNETIDIQLTVSHDNQHWARVANQATFLPLGSDGEWDDGMVFAFPMIQHQDRVLIVYGAWDGHHEADERHAGIGLATLRKDGFVSLEAGNSLGTVTTRPMRNAQGPLLINADASGGSIRVEAIGIDGHPFPGYSARDSVEIRTDSIRQVVTWKASDELPETDDPIQLRFLLTNASLYSFLAGPEVERYEPFCTTEQ
jgi:hypothetical protein